MYQFFWSPEIHYNEALLYTFGNNEKHGVTESLLRSTETGEAWLCDQEVMLERVNSYVLRRVVERHRVLMYTVNCKQQQKTLLHAANEIIEQCIFSSALSDLFQVVCAIKLSSH